MAVGARFLNDLHGLIDGHEYREGRRVICILSIDELVQMDGVFASDHF